MNDRDKRGERRRRRAGRTYSPRDIGDGMEQATADAILRAMGGLPPGLDWPAIAPSVIPILPRRRPMPPMAGEPFRVTLPPGIPTGFGIDVGPAFLVVGRDLLGTWPVGPADVVARGLENIRARLHPVRRRDLVREAVDGVPVRVLQSGTGCASALVLIPDELQRIFGQEPQCLIAPMRDLLISMPADTDRTFITWLNEEFAGMDPNGLALDAFVLADGALRYEALRGAAVVNG